MSGRFVSEGSAGSSSMEASIISRPCESRILRYICSLPFGFNKVRIWTRSGLRLLLYCVDETLSCAWFVTILFDSVFITMFWLYFTLVHQVAGYSKALVALTGYHSTAARTSSDSGLRPIGCILPYRMISDFWFILTRFTSSDWASKSYARSSDRARPWGSRHGIGSPYSCHWSRWFTHRCNLSEMLGFEWLAGAYECFCH
jgi:hypothetical protein